MPNKYYISTMHISITLLLFLHISLFGDEKRFNEFVKNSHIIVEGSVLKSMKLSTYDSGYIVDNSIASKVENNLSDLSRLEIWMDLVKVKKVILGDVKVGATVTFFYTKRDPKLAKVTGMPLTSQYIYKNTTKKIEQDIIYIAKINRIPVHKYSLPYRMITFMDTLIRPSSDLSPKDFIKLTKLASNRNLQIIKANEKMALHTWGMMDSYLRRA